MQGKRSLRQGKTPTVRSREVYMIYLQDNCGFELLQAPKIVQPKPPTEEELCILREEVDPYRYVIGR